MDRFIAKENIKHFRERLRTERGPRTRQTLQKLLIEEEDKLGASLELVAEIERAIAEFDALIGTQQKLVTVLQRDDVAGAAQAKALLDGLIESQAVHRNYHQRMVALCKEPRS